MKKLFTIQISLFVLFLAITQIGISQNVGINATGATANASAMLDITSTTKGLLIPRMTSVQRAAIASPATGLLVYDTNLNSFYFFNGTSWNFVLNGNSGWNLAGNAAAASDFIGTTNAIDFVTRTNNTERMRVTSAGNVGIGTNNPTQALQVNGNISLGSYTQSGSVFIGKTGTSNNFTAGSGESGIEIESTILGGNYSQKVHILSHRISASSGRRMTIDEVGNVGIGTTTPNAALQFGNVLSNRRIVLWENFNNDHQIYGFGINANMIRYQTADVSTDHVFYAGVNSTTSNELVRVKGNGNVGIGTNAPGAKLEVVGKIFSTGGSAEVSTQDRTTFTQYTMYGSAGAMKFWRGDYGDVMAISSLGNVSIGGFTNAAKLEVVGQVKITGGAPGAGKVLTSDATGLASWTTPGAATGLWSTLGNAAVATDFIGTTNAIDFVTRTNNTERMRVTSAGDIGMGINVPVQELHLYRNTGTNVELRTQSSATDFVDFGSGPAGSYVYSYGVKPLYFGTNAVERMRIDATGNVGIGTVAPDSKLQVTGAVGATSMFKANTSATDFVNMSVAAAGGGQLQMVGWALGWNINSLTAGKHLYINRDVSATSDLYLGRVGLETFISGSTGNVGIGTTTPGAKLEVAGQVKITGGAPGAGKVLTSDAAGLASWAAPASSGWGILGNAAVATDFIGTTNAIDFVTRTNNIERMRITAGGNVGIGTTTPNAALQLGNVITNRRIVLWESANNDHQYYGFGINGNTLRYQVDGTASDHVFFVGNGAGASTELMRVKGNGNVGIGTAAPGYKLEVTGNAFLSGNLGIGVNTNTFRRATRPLGFTDVFDAGQPNGVLISNQEIEEGGFWANGNYAMIFSPGDNDLLKIVDEDWFDNLGTAYDNTAMKARVDNVGAYFQVSDRNAKTNIVPISNALSKLNQISGYTYEFIRNEKEIAKGQKPIPSAGVIAQEVEKILPQAVSNEDGHYMVNYSAITPLLIQAIKEQQQLIEDLKKRVEALEKK